MRTDGGPSTRMKALVYGGPTKRAWEERPRPQLVDMTDVIVQMTTSTLCGTDLHILRGDVPTVSEGRILGHEGVGVVTEAGSAVSAFRPGDRVIISCITSCARCDFCRKGMPSHCRHGGWILGHTIDGTQAEYVRIPHADSSLHPLPVNGNEEALVMLSDVLPTGFECGVLNGQVSPGDTVAIVGAGPIGLAVLLTAQLYSPAAVIVIDHDQKRLEIARQFGATEIVNSGDGHAVKRVLASTGGDGADVVVESVGFAVTFDMCQGLVATGGRIANIGVHGAPVWLRLDRLWDRNITLTTRLVDTTSTPRLLAMVQRGQLDPRRLISHRFAFDDIMQAYDTFEHAAEQSALKVILHRDTAA